VASVGGDGAIPNLARGEPLAAAATSGPGPHGEVGAAVIERSGVEWPSSGVALPTPSWWWGARALC
jgi:hypothetical protein